MSRPSVHPSGREVLFDPAEIIVSKTDLRGAIQYANDVFLRVSGYTEAELIGQQHNIIRHPDMPRCVFKLLWDTLGAGQEIFAYVLNMAKNGDHYWVFAHVTPSYNQRGERVGYHSNRRVPHADALAKVKGLYAQWLAAERRHPNPQEGMRAGEELIRRQLQNAGLDYSEFVFSLSEHTRLSASLK